MRKHLKYLRQQKGLTLVELLAVLVILGIVAAIAVPMIGNIIQDSKDKATVNEALSIISAAKLADSNNENPTSGNTYSIDDLKNKGYLDIDGYGSVSVEKREDSAATSKRLYWVLLLDNENDSTIKDAVNRLVADSFTGDEITEKQLLNALDKKNLNAN